MNTITSSSATTNSTVTSDGAAAPSTHAIRGWGYGGYAAGWGYGG